MLKLAIATEEGASMLGANDGYSSSQRCRASSSFLITFNIFCIGFKPERWVERLPETVG